MIIMAMIFIIILSLSFAKYQTILNSHYLWIERNLILGFVSNLYLTIIIYQENAINFININTIILLYTLSFIVPVLIFNIFFKILDKEVKKI